MQCKLIRLLIIKISASNVSVILFDVYYSYWLIVVRKIPMDFKEKIFIHPLTLPRNKRLKTISIEFHNVRSIRKAFLLFSNLYLYFYRIFTLLYLIATGKFDIFFIYI